MKFWFSLFLLMVSTGAFSQKITKLEVFADPSDNQGKCPVSIRFKALITYTGSGKIKFKWQRSDLSKMKPIEKILSGKSGDVETIDSIFTNWNFSNGLKQRFSGFQSFVILSPDSIVSNKAYFTVQCQNSFIVPNQDSNFKKTIIRNLRSHYAGPFPLSFPKVSQNFDGNTTNNFYQISIHNDPEPEHFTPSISSSGTQKQILNFNRMGEIKERIGISTFSSSFLVSDYPLEASTIYPGGIFDANQFINGIYKEIPVKRNPIQISISNLNRTNNSSPIIRVKDPDLNHVNLGISKLFQGTENLNQSEQFNYNIYEHIGYFDYTIMASGGLGFCSFCSTPSARFNTLGSGSSANQPIDSTFRHFIIDARKVLFTINADRDSTGFFIKNIEDEKGKQPLVIKSVQYGARVLMEVDIKNSESDYYQNLPYGAFNNNPDQLFKYMKLKGDSLVIINARVFGGDGSFSPIPELKTLNEKLSSFFDKINNQNAIPIGFQMGDLNNQLLTVRTDLIPPLNFNLQYPFITRINNSPSFPSLKYVFAKVDASNLNSHFNQIKENYDFTLVVPSSPLDSTAISEITNASDGTTIINPNSNFNIYYKPDLSLFIKNGGGYLRIFGHRIPSNVNSFYLNDFPSNISLKTVSLTLVFSNGTTQKLTWTPETILHLSNSSIVSNLKLYFSCDKNGNLSAINP